MFKTFEQFINEDLPKNKWLTLDQPISYSNDLITLVKKAYSKTDMGSFINTKSDIKRSNWLSIDFDSKPDVDATIFYRTERKNENWKGKKIQGLGHDNSKDAINYVLEKLEEVLKRKGIWLEGSGALEKVLYRMNVPYVKDENLAQEIFPNSDLKFIGNKGQYTRKLENGELVTETIFGKPQLK